MNGVGTHFVSETAALFDGLVDAHDGRQADAHRRTQDEALIEAASRLRDDMTFKVLRAFVRPEEGDRNLPPAEFAETVAYRLLEWATLERKRIQDGIDASGFTETQLTAIIGRNYVVIPGANHQGLRTLA